MNIGLTILKNLGLTDAEAETLEREPPKPQNTIFARNQAGLGYKEIKANYVAEADDVFSRISAKAGNNKSVQRSCIAATSAPKKPLPPRRLQKWSVGSLSSEDLAAVLSKPDDDDVVPAPTAETPKKRRKHHHSHISA